MDPANLANKLATVLNEVVPSPFSVDEYQGMIMFRGGSFPVAADVADHVDLDGDPVELAGIAALECLSTVQTCMIENTGHPWPADGGSPPVPRVDVTDDLIRLWFEEPNGQTILSLSNVPW